MQNIKLTVSGNRADIVLNRPHKHNAFNPEMIGELRDVLDELEKQEAILFIVLSGEGTSFCAGADLEWFAGTVSREKEQVTREYEQLAALLEKLAHGSKITIGAAHRTILGGANGLLAACDFVVADEPAEFAFSEVRLGIIPATIMPFVARRVAIRHLRKLMFSGERFGAREAHLIGLVDFIAPENEHLKMAAGLIDGLKLSAPGALKACKQLLLKVGEGKIGTHDGSCTASVLADLIDADEGREGIAAFLEKRKPEWVQRCS